MQDDAADHLAADRRLASRILAGDDEAFAEFVRVHHSRVVRIAGRFFRRPDVIEDVAQEVFVKAYGAIRGYRGEVPIGHWLSRITVNACYDQLRRQRVRPEIGFSQLGTGADETVPYPGSAAAHRAAAEWQREEARIDAERLLARLAAADRVVLTLLVLEGMSVAEVAALTGWSAANVKIRAFRARNRLRKLLTAGPPDGGEGSHAKHPA